MIHQYQLNGYNIVLDTYSGAVHVVDEVAYDVIAMYETHKKEEIISAILKKYQNNPEVTEQEVQDVYSGVEELKKTGQLFTEDLYADIAANFKMQNNDIKALCLHVAHTCNLTCDYCFASQGKYQGDNALMSFEVGKQAFDFLIAHSGNRKNLEVDFFGGEPLMDWNIVKRLVEYARSIEQQHNKKFRFTLTTNGLLLNDDMMEFANKEMHNVVLSLDGRKEIHDKLRRTAGGQGSYDVIVPKFQKFVQSRNNKGYYIRGTFTHDNVDFTKDVFHMADLGFTELSMEPVVCDPKEPYALTEADLPKLFGHNTKYWQKSMLRENKRKENPLHSIII